MEIRPVDLGSERLITLIHLRAGMHMAGNTRPLGRALRGIAPSEKPRLGLMGRLWSQGTGMSDWEVQEALRGMTGIVGGFVGGFVGGSTGFWVPTITLATQGMPELACLFGAMGVAMTSIGVMWPGVALRRFATNPLTYGEVDILLEQAPDVLTRSYLTLLHDALQQENITGKAADDVRAALRALGEALDRLPSHVNVTEADADQLRQEAETVEAQANAEPDATISASLSRRAEALSRSANAAQRSSLVLRRAAALREELSTQIEALRLELTSLYTGNGDTVDLSRLAETVRGVATEASAVADARNELDAITTPLPVIAPSQTVQVGGKRR